MSQKIVTRSIFFFFEILLREVSKYNLEDPLRRILKKKFFERVTFFLTCVIDGKKLKYYYTLTANNFALKTPPGKNYHIFGNLRTSAFQCTMVPLLTRSCFKSNKVRLISNDYFLRAISKNICLNVFESKQRRENLFLLILKL